MQPLVQIDPATLSSDPEVFVANHVYDYLVDVTAGNSIAPRLATEWKVSDDGLQYVFTLASGAAFHDGSALTAKDVVWTFDRLRNPDSGYPTASLYSNIAKIEATGDLEVTFTLTQPNPFFLFDLSDNHALIVKTDTQDFSKFNGTGPFKVVEYSPEDRIVMEANQDYFLEGQPKLTGLEVIFFNDQTAMVDALKSGDVDLTMAFSTDLYTSLKDFPGITRLETPTNMFDVVRLRSDRAPGNNPLVIQAMKLALDRQAVHQLVMPGYGEIGRDSPIGPMYTQYFEALDLPAKDATKARDLLTQAGYPDGLKLDLHTPDTGNRPQLAVVLKDQWAEAGIDVNVMVEPESVYYGDNGWMEVDLGITGWGSRPYPQFYLDMMLACDAEWNESHFCDSEFDELTKTASTTLDEAARVDAYRQIQGILLDRGPIIIPYFYTQVGAISDNFQDFEFKAFSGRSDVRNVSLAD
jgi:peptide/nickel transport system substrate-binding protein